MKAEITDRFWSALSPLEGPAFIEQSAKLGNGRLHDDRFLVSFPREALLPGAGPRLNAICTRLGAPGTALAPLADLQKTASSVHFGLEPESGITKCYLEFEPADAPEPGLVFLALKWTEDRAALNRYRALTALVPAAKSAEITVALPDSASRRLALACLERAGKDEPAVLLEVTEEGSPRRSFDINLADCGITLNSMAKMIAETFAEQNLDASGFLTRHGDEKFSHYAVGMGRDGTAFSTFYFGAHRRE